jgi:hypothetical protein
MTTEENDVDARQAGNQRVQPCVMSVACLPIREREPAQEEKEFLWVAEKIKLPKFMVAASEDN